MKFLFLILFLSSCSSLDTPQFAAPGESAATRGEPNSKPVSERGNILLSWPLRGSFNLTRGFLTGIRKHQGLDLSAPRGTPIRSSHAGYVEYAGRDFSGYGSLVIINSGAKWATFYAHLHKIHVREGQTINRGDIIGTMGATGNARGVHLHFELRHEEEPVDPMIYLP